jgi:hypothetical protein
MIMATCKGRNSWLLSLDAGGCERCDDVAPRSFPRSSSRTRRGPYNNNIATATALLLYCRDEHDWLFTLLRADENFEQIASADISMVYTINSAQGFKDCAFLRLLCDMRIYHHVDYI